MFTNVMVSATKSEKIHAFKRCPAGLCSYSLKIMYPTVLMRCQAISFARMYTNLMVLATKSEKIHALKRCPAGLRSY
jgi:predicted secreted protein